MPIIDVDHVRRLFDEQVRRGTASDGTGTVVTAAAQVVRWCADGDVGWSEIAWSKLDDDVADEVIADQVAFFTSKAQGFAWRVYDADQPEDLGARLECAGLHLSYTSELMIAQVADVPRGVDLPTGTSLVSANDPTGIERLIEVHERVFELDHSQLRRSLLAQLANAPEKRELFVVMAGDVPVASARVDFLPDREFASLWGGSTLREWRGRGLFRALVAHRADAAASRGYRYLYVTASSQSRPVLERLGFASFGSVVTFMWEPPSPLP